MYRLLHCLVEDSFPKETIKPFYREIFYFGLRLKREGTKQISKQLIIQSISTKPFHLFKALLFFPILKKCTFLLSKSFIFVVEHLERDE